MTLQEAKDLAAKEIGYRDWDDIVLCLANYTIKEASQSQFSVATNLAMEIYAKSKWDEACEEQKKLCKLSYAIRSDIPVQFSSKTDKSIDRAPKPEFRP